MYATHFVRLLSIVAAGCCVLSAARPASAQSSPPESHQGATPAQIGSNQPQPQHDMQHMHLEGDQNMVMPSTREGSGTSWLPDETPMYAIHTQAGGWTLMTHGTAFLQYLHETGDRGSHQFGSTTGSWGWPIGPQARGILASAA